MDQGLFTVLAIAAVTIGSLHALAPDHWMPFAALARAQGWSPGRTARITVACGLAHVTASALLGLLGLALGVQLLEAFGRRMEAMAGLLLIGFGMAYGLWGLRRAIGHRLHDHAHAHGLAHTHAPHAHEDAPRRATGWTLLLLFAADPCVELIPMMFAAAPLGLPGTLGIVGVYAVATCGTMVALVLPARAAVTRVRGAWLSRYGHAAAGGIIVFVGVAVAGLGW
jgi:hypothetical protein